MIFADKRLLSVLLACTIARALQTIRPGAQWNLRGYQYAGLEWIDQTQAKPTESELNAALAACDQSENATGSIKTQAKLDVKNKSKTAASRMDALVILLDLDQ